MSFGSPKTPAAPDPNKLIEQQQAASQISQFTPEGNLLYGSVDGSGNFAPRNSGTAVQVTQTPFQKDLQGKSENIALQLAGQINPQLPEITFDGLPGYTSVDGIRANIGTGEDIKNAKFKQITDLLNPQFDRQERRLEQRLSDQGLPMGSEAYSGGFDDFNRGKNAALTDAALQATLAGADEQQRLLGNELTLAGLERSDRGTELGQKQDIRGQQFNEVASLFGLNPTPQFQQTQGVDAANITLGANQLAQNNAALKAQNRQSNTASIGSLLGTGALAGGMFLASDRRLKENIRKVGKNKDFNIYSYNYKGFKNKFIGVIADEVKKIMPQAVTEINGYLAVNYNMIGIPFIQI